MMTVFHFGGDYPVNCAGVEVFVPPALGRS